MITVTGVDHAISALAKYVNIQLKLNEIAKRLCEIGEPIISQVHGNHSHVWTEPTPEGYKIVAEGHRDRHGRQSKRRR